AMYRMGDGTDQNQAVADEWLAKYRQHRPYDPFRECDNVPPSEFSACIEQTRRDRATKGSAEDEEALADDYRTNRQNFVEAVKWYKRAIERGSNTAAQSLGENV